MSLYLYIILLLTIVAIALSFNKRLKFHSYCKSILVPVISGGATFVIWTFIATNLSYLNFNQYYIYGIRILNVPVEELLLLIIMPYAIILTSEMVKAYIGERKVKIKSYIINSILILNLILIILFFDKVYTVTSLILFSFSLLLLKYFFSDLYLSYTFWGTILLLSFPFLIVNSIIYSLPIIEYSPFSIIGIKILVVPIENFFFAFTFTVFCLSLYNKVKTKSHQELN